MTATPAGEQHTGSLGLTGEGQETGPISEAMVGAGWVAAGHTTLHGDRAAQIRAALEAAYPAIRQQVAEEIAAALDERHRSNLAITGGDKDIIPREGRVGLATGYQRAAQIARDIGGQA